MSSNPVIWSPSIERMQSSAMFDFMRERGFEDYASLYRWSVEDLESFWRCVAVTAMFALIVKLTRY